MDLLLHGWWNWAPELCQERLIPHSDLKGWQHTGINYQMNQPSTRPVLADVSMKNKPFLRSRRNATTKPETHELHHLVRSANVCEIPNAPIFQKQNFSIQKTNYPQQRFSCMVTTMHNPSWLQHEKLSGEPSAFLKAHLSAFQVALVANEHDHHIPWKSGHKNVTKICSYRHIPLSHLHMIKKCYVFIMFIYHSEQRNTSHHSTSDHGILTPQDMCGIHCQHLAPRDGCAFCRASMSHCARRSKDARRVISYTSKAPQVYSNAAH